MYQSLSDRQKGIILLISSAFFFSLMNAGVRVAGDLPAAQKAFFRNFVSFVAAFIWARAMGIRFSGRRANIPDLVMRSLSGGIGIFTSFYALDHLLMADATMLSETSPFFAIIFSAVILRERVTARTILIMLAAFAGCLLVLRPSGVGISLIPGLAGLATGACGGLAYTYVRKLAEEGEAGPFIVMFFAGFASLMSVPSLILDFHAMTLYQTAALIAAGGFATIAQFLVTAAYAHAPAREISIYDYSMVLFTALFGFILYGEVSDAISLLGYAVIIGAAILMYLTGRHADN